MKNEDACGDICVSRKFYTHKKSAPRFLLRECSAISFHCYKILVNFLFHDVPNRLISLHNSCRANANGISITAISSSAEDSVHHRVETLRHHMKILSPICFISATSCTAHLSSGDTMLRSETLFGKRETNSPNSPFSANNNLTQPGVSNVSKTATPTSTSSSGSQPNNNSGSNEMGSKLIVGPNIKLKGVEINDCDTLVVEGRVEATMDSRVIQIAEKGAFKGSAEIDLAEIRGDFDGDLTVRQKLVIYSSGRVSGKIRYGKLVIEEGGQLSGDVQVGGSAEQRELLQAKTA
jgi:cytoskeletal protein CcmA (bactofilin family)